MKWLVEFKFALFSHHSAINGSRPSGATNKLAGALSYDNGGDVAIARERAAQ